MCHLRILSLDKAIIVDGDRNLGFFRGTCRARLGESFEYQASGQIGRQYELLSVILAG
jgi:glutamine amidotransferase-like uncharacterized protein